MAVEIIGDLIGKTFDRVVAYGDPKDELCFESDTNQSFTFYHDQDCCETVIIKDICGDLSDLTGSLIIEAEKVVKRFNDDPSGDLIAWTFYKFSTEKGSVTVQWLGASNGYYSVEVHFRHGGTSHNERMGRR